MNASKKAAFISTAYADEEKSDADKAKELLEKLNKNTAEMKSYIGDKKEEKPEDKKPEEKKPEEKPADKDADKKTS